MKTVAFFLVFGFLILASCSQEEDITPPPDSEPNPIEKLYQIPIVVHVLHFGEPLGEGNNLSKEKILRQIEIVNEDFRRKAGTRGFNNHPEGADSRIKFVLAKTDPQGNPTNGIVRINTKTTPNPLPSNHSFDFYAGFSYWDPALYLNVWSIPLGDLVDAFLGEATGPNTDLPGGHLFTPGEPLQSEGILINSAHFGESDLNSEHNLGRTLTHEIGHYLGLLHTWGEGDCIHNDFCKDTPPVSSPVTGCPHTPPIACDGSPVMIENYMNYTYDRCMNMFTKDQIARMHYVLENSPYRSSLLNSPGLKSPL